jgi:hypothetical protein
MTFSPSACAQRPTVHQPSLVRSPRGVPRILGRYAPQRHALDTTSRPRPRLVTEPPRTRLPAQAARPSLRTPRVRGLNQKACSGVMSLPSGTPGLRAGNRLGTGFGDTFRPRRAISRVRRCPRERAHPRATPVRGRRPRRRQRGSRDRGPGGSGHPAPSTAATSWRSPSLTCPGSACSSTKRPGRSSARESVSPSSTTTAAWNCCSTMLVRIARRRASSSLRKAVRTGARSWPT